MIFLLIKIPNNLDPLAGSNQVFIQRSGIEGGDNMCAVPPVVVDHANVVKPQFDDVFGCWIEMNDEQYNEQYNELYNEHNNDPNHEVVNEANNE